MSDAPDKADRPARVQVTKAKLQEVLEERKEESALQSGGSVYNTWYRKWSGGDPRKKISRSAFKCKPSQDSGRTRSNGPYFCLWFARGACYKGSDCLYLHRIPQPGDGEQLDRTTDCFGRTKFADFREDMSGVGSFLYPTRTLFVGYFNQKVNPNTLRTQFEQWGPLESVRMGKNNSIAFVTYKTETNAEFASEAMAYQSITGKETLVIRWSRDKHNTSEVTPEQEDEIREIVRSVIAKKRKAS